jgi:hypothetical protein
MTGFVEQLRLAEKAAEDIYFAKLNRELIEALHRLTEAQKTSSQPADRASQQRWEGRPHAMTETRGG